jgi:hypothetical protein
MEPIVGVTFAAVAGYFGYRLIRYKGFRGAMFGAEIRKTIGEVEGASVGPVRRVLRVHVLDSESAPEKNVGLEFVRKSFTSYKMIPVALSRAEAVNLIALLQQAAGGKITA